jgi:hypothetical protein
MASAAFLDLPVLLPACSLRLSEVLNGADYGFADGARAC